MAIDVGTSTQVGSSSNSAASSRSKSTLDYDNFLQLMIAEMRHQDPTDPMKATDYMAQLASFSNVEQAIQTNAKLDSLLTASALAQADAVLGHTVTSPDETISGKVASLRITADGLVATLDNGKELTLGAGIRIS